MAQRQEPGAGFVWRNPQTDLPPLGLAFLLSSSLGPSSSAHALPLPTESPTPVLEPSSGEASGGAGLGQVALR